jgi:hypothetical protein
MSLVSISSLSSSDPGKGHWYWFYRYLFDYQVGLGLVTGRTIGPTQASCEHVVGVLRLGRVNSRSFITWFFRNRYSNSVLRETRSALRAGAQSFQFYDGSAADLLLAFRLALRYPEGTFLFNFHWPVEWLGVLQGRGLLERAFTFSVAMMLQGKPRNLALAAETKTFAEPLRGLLGIELENYPVFAAFDRPVFGDWTTRKWDVLIFPHRESEIPFSVDLLRSLEGKQLKVKIVVSEKIWTAGAAPGLDPRQPTSLASDRSPIFTPLPLERYVALLADSRVVVLPYSDAYFKWGSSGKFNDSIAAGAFPLVPEGSAMATQSSLTPDQHTFKALDVGAAARLISTRLNKGFDNQLQPIWVDDLLKLLDRASAPASGVRHRAFLALRFARLTSVLLSFRYSLRRPGKFLDLRSACLRTLDKLMPSRKTKDR